MIPPFWRRDLTREIDLVEEVARIHGYDKIPEDASVPMVPSHRTREDRVLARVRHALAPTRPRGTTRRARRTVSSRGWPLRQPAVFLLVVTANRD